MGVGGLDGGGDVDNVVREEAAGGRAALAVSRVVGGAGRRVWRARRRRMVMNEALRARAGAVSATSVNGPVSWCRVINYWL